MCNLLHAIIACNKLHAIYCTCNHGFTLLLVVTARDRSVERARRRSRCVRPVRLLGRSRRSRRRHQGRRLPAVLRPQPDTIAGLQQRRHEETRYDHSSLASSSLRPPCVSDADVIFLSCFFFLLSFFRRLISAAADWMSTVLLHMVWS